MRTWDLVVVGAGPAGSAAALGALAARPDLSVLLLDRSGFPRDKACGDGIAPHVLDVLADVGVAGIVDGWTPVRHFSLQHADEAVVRPMRRPVWVVPRLAFDHRLVDAAVGAGAVFRRHRVRAVRLEHDAAVLDDELRAQVVVGADGAHSVLRSASGLPPTGRRALALRGYAPTPAGRRGRQVIVYGRRRQPSYAWSFDRGDGMANVGYGELLDQHRPPPSRARLLTELERLLPGSTADAGQWRGHQLPLSSRSWDHPDGRVLLAGDAAGLVNPMTGEGIYYAVATGVLAGRAAVAALDRAAPGGAGARHRCAVRALLAAHLRHTALASQLASMPRFVSAGVRAAARDQRVFDDLVELGLGRGRVTPRVTVSLLRSLMSSEPR
jgi:geranylgeranyl reductase family protein